MYPPSRQFLPAGSCLAALALALAGCGHRQPAAAAAPASPGVVVVAADAVVRTVPITIDSVGHLDAAATVKVVPLVNARIDALPVADGADVKAGEVLIRFDDRAYAAQLARMRTARDAQAAQVAALQSRAERSKDLVSGDFLSAQDVQEAQASLAQAQASLAAADAGVAQATIDFENCAPKAPFDGRIGLLKSGAVVGNFVAAGGDPLLELRSLDKLKVEFTVPGASIGTLQEMAAAGQTPQVMVSQHGDTAHGLAGAVAAYDNAIDPSSRSLQVRALVDNPGRRFWPGQFVDVQMIVGTAENAVLIPPQAVNTGPNGPYVYVVDGGKAAIRPVTLGAETGGLVVVKTGVQAGQKVILSGQLGLQDGSPVKVSTSSEVAAAP
ncbi:MAG TPA: efflux RND transporter periplasmic adaptor subunit [Opitutaceae bacterium]|jgi:multidrug efflux system membrane fusion protein|nr:efflux RND transporter periplasmic adaptor subunit [Opitutaceae bacterium]